MSIVPRARTPWILLASLAIGSGAPTFACGDAPPPNVGEAGSTGSAGGGGQASGDAGGSGGSGGAVPVDPDGDGLVGATDACPDEAEDEDGLLDADGCPEPGDGNGALPTRPVPSGVAYVAHYLSPELRWYRLDGDAPSAAGALAMSAESHDAALDATRDLLFVVHHTAKAIAVYRLSRPDSPAAPVAEPALVATIETSGDPYFARVNPQTKRLYVVQAPAEGEPPLDGFELLAYDVTDPAAPALVPGWPREIPSTTSLDLDAARNVLFVVHGPSNTLHGFDLHDDGLEPLPGEPIDLLALYPEENSFAFQARNLTADPASHRLYAARPQSLLSELLVLEYPAAIPRGGARYGQMASMDDLAPVADPFDLALPAAERPHLLSAFTPLPDPELGALFLVAGASEGQSIGAIALGMSGEPLTLGPGCGDYEGFGCLLRTYEAGQPKGLLGTDGAACLDTKRRVLVATSIASPETSPGAVHFFRYEPDLTMSRWLTEAGSNAKASALPNNIVCH